MHDFVKRFVEARLITLLNSSILQVPSAYLLLSSHTNPEKLTLHKYSQVHQYHPDLSCGL